ncbi:Vigilin [Ceraceosorus bombacis]|uniref:Vigilin n=1 Tax=Ceraceosorus bombacis TaxID=401625 RepID=A0A0P1BNR6_9BASI|nr:Vigilin [Ceraceosorus bombacis]
MTRIQSKYKSIKIEASSTRKTGTTTFVIKGNNEKEVKAARKELTVGLAKNVSLTVLIPSSLRAFVIGTKGKNLKTITDSTGVRINIPKAEEGDAGAAVQVPGPAASGEIDYDAEPQITVTIDGDEINARSAVKQIQALVAERISRTTQRLSNIDHILYPFIAGARNANAQRLESEIGQGDVSIRVPPRAAFLAPKDREEEEAEQDGGKLARVRDLNIVVTGDRDLVARVVATIESQVDEMKRSFRTLQISIPKRQHRLLVGDAAQDILASTGCSVELAPIDDPSDSVTIRGPQTKLALALTAAMEKANAVRVEVVDLTSYHRGQSGSGVEHAKLILRWLQTKGKLPRTAGAQVYTPRPAIIESSGSVQLEIVGSDGEAVNAARASIDESAKLLSPASVRAIEIDPLLHRFIIGKNGSGLATYSKRGVDVLFPPAPTGDLAGEGRSDVALVFHGSSGATDKKGRDAEVKALLDVVEQELSKAAGLAADLKSEVITVPQKHHRSLVGPNGTTLNAIIGEERLVTVKLGQALSATGGLTPSEDSITVRGPTSEVARVVAELKRVAKDAVEDAIVNGHVEEFSVDATHVPHLVGKGGAAVTKLREELGVRVDFDGAAKADDAATSKRPVKNTKAKVTITGRKENVLEALRRLQAQAAQLADETLLTVKAPASMHGAIIGQGGKYVTRLQDTYGVRINFPTAGDANAKPDEVTIRGGKKGAEAARSELLELIEFEKENNHSTNITVSTKSIARIMGKGGSTVNKLRDDTGAQIDVDRAADDTTSDGTTLIKIRGTKDAVAAAKGVILSIAKEVDAEQTIQLDIPAKHHGLLLGAGGQNLRDLIARAAGEAAADPRANASLVQFPRRGDKAAAADIVTIRGPGDLARKVAKELEKAAAELGSRVVYGVVVAAASQRSLQGGVREVQQLHNVRLILPSYREYESSEAPINESELATAAQGTVVKLQGKEADCKAAAKDILERFTSHTKTVEVPRSLSSKLFIQFSRSLREEGVSLSIGEEDSAAVSWTLSARDAASLETAAERILKAVSGTSAETHEGRLTVDQSVVPRLIGRQGSALREHEQASGAKINIPKGSNGLVIIRGSKDQVLSAKDRIAHVANSPRGYRGD